MSTVEKAVAALRAGRPVILPTDTVYGLCADPREEAAVSELIRLKGRPREMPIALVAASVDGLLELLPELPEGVATVCRRLLPGPYTLVVPDAPGRFAVLAGRKRGTLGVRVPDLPAEAREVVERAGGVAATSANAHGGPDPGRIEDIPRALREAAGAIVDGGPLPGTASTVVDLTGLEPQVLREGAVAAAEALATIERAASE